MTAFTDNERRVVPRWRELHETLLDSQELRYHSSSPIVPDPNREFERLASIWHKCPSPLSAYDFVSTAVILDRVQEAQDAFDFIRNNEDLPDSIKSVSFSDPKAFIDQSLSDSTLSNNRKIRYLKDVLQRWPRNAICWTQLGLLYSRVGVNHKAQRCVEIGLSIAPHSRYVLRSACRFFVHMNDATRAVWELRRCERTPKDPWLMAAEISCSQILSQSSPLLLRGIKELGRKRLPPWSVTELAASIGTFEIENGSQLKAKRFFRVGAEAPNGNVKAQLQWLRIHHAKGVPANAPLRDSLDDHEACALDLRVDGRWSEAILSCEEWGKDEFFSERPFCLGSYIAIEALGDADHAERILREGLIANRNDTVLLNNLAIALAMQGKLEESKSTLANAEKKIAGSPFEDKVILMATSGLVAYRSGNVDRGRNQYLKVMKMTSENGRRDETRRAALYMALEELEARTAESKPFSTSILEKVEKAGTSDGWPEREALLRRVKQALKARGGDSIDAERESIGDLIDAIP